MKIIETRIDASGYVIWNCGLRKGGPVLEHIVIAEDIYGGELPTGLHVHHIDGDKTNNHINNLMLLSQSYHREIHRRMNAKKACGFADWRKCKHCKKYGNKDMLHYLPNGCGAYHRSCKAKAQRELMKNPIYRENQRNNKRINKNKYNQNRKIKYHKTKNPVALLLHVRKIWFNEIKSGNKVFEYRLYNEYWARRLIDRNYSKTIITLGYPKRDDVDKRIIKTYQGYEVKHITHPEFGPKPVKVFAIKLK